MLAAQFRREPRSAAGRTGSRTLPGSFLALLLLGALSLFCPPSALAHRPPYHDYLAPHGSWSRVPAYGWVWIPRVAIPAWRPYTVGHWEYTEFGWTWVSDEPWGEVVFHYGRWVYLPSTGWAWVPGTLWGPAWVTWRWGPDYLGWAPLPPEAYWMDDYIVCPPSLLPPAAWIFVESRFVSDRHLHRHLLAPRRNHHLVARTKYLTRFIHRGGRHIRNLGPPRERFDRLRARRHRSERVREATFDFGPRENRTHGWASTPAGERRKQRGIDPPEKRTRDTTGELRDPPREVRARHGRPEGRGVLSVMRSLRSRTPPPAPEAGQALPPIGRPSRESSPASGGEAGLGWRRQRAPSQGIPHNKSAAVGASAGGGAGLGLTGRAASPFAARGRAHFGAMRSGRASFSGRGVQAGSAIRGSGSLRPQGFRRAR